MSGTAGGDAAATPGERLRLARTGRGWSAAHAAELMRVPVGVVESLEADRYTDLGAAVFARGHLRRYATLLDLPADALIEGYDRSSAGPAAPSLIPAASARTPVRPERDRRRLLRAVAYAAVVTAAAALSAAAWWWWSARQSTAERPAPAPAAAPRSDSSTEIP